jgi:hypothetical protein
MNVVTYKSNHEDIVYIFVDRTSTYKNNWTTEIIKNITDFNISNIWSKGYSVIVGIDEDQLLKSAVKNNFKIAVVLSTGTDFINGDSFFNAVKELSYQDFFIAGHILDRKEGYYELHHQCYIINLKIYQSLGLPDIGQEELGSTHRQCIPWRSFENIHDDYTPLWISGGDDYKTYSHKLHGWNILSTAFKNDLTVKVFDDNFRHNKKYYYPDNNKEFIKHIAWAYSREKYCSIDFVHTAHTEVVNITEKDFECIITPASGAWFTPHISKDKPVTVLYYDYNQKSLDYWKEHAPKIDNVTYEFIKIDLLGICNYNTILPKGKGKTIINLSNIFCYEGTSTFLSLSYRLSKENELLDNIPEDYFVVFNSRSCKGFYNALHQGKKLEKVKITELLKPSWHINQDWTI